MPIQTVWVWTQFVHASSDPRNPTGPVSGSHDFHMPAQSFLYASTAIQRLQIGHGGGGSGYSGVVIDADAVIASYTVNGAPRPGGHVILDSNVDSVSFLWKVFPGQSGVPGAGAGGEVDVQFLAQVFGWG